MDNMGNAWAEILFNTCFESDWMVDLYAKSSPFPVGTIVVHYIPLAYTYSI